MARVEYVLPGSVVESVAGAFSTKSSGKRLRFEQAATRYSVNRAIGKRALRRKRLFILPVDEIEPPLRDQPVAVADHFRNLVRGVDVDERERDMAEKGLPREPEKDCAILSDRPQHPQLFEARVCFPKYVNAPGLDVVQMLHVASFDFP